MDVLANWLWQGGAVAIAATVILRASRRMSATTRYNIWWVALAIVLALPALAWLSTFGMEPRAAAAGAGDAVHASTTAASPSDPAPGVILPAAPGWVIPLLAAFWSLWVIVSLARLISACVALRQVKRTTREFPASREQRLAVWLSLRGSGRRVKLALSSDVHAASVIGLVSPTIAIAPRTLDALTDAELDQIVVHEWAHVQRGDDVARLIQRIIGSVAGLHPAIWWIDRQLNLERETACDDWAIRIAGSGRSLAVCLTKLASLPGRDVGAVLAPAAIITSELTTRVHRLLDGRRNTSTRATLGVPMIVTTILVAVAVTVAGVELVATAPAASAHIVLNRASESRGEVPRRASVSSVSEPSPERSAAPRSRRPSAGSGANVRPNRVESAARQVPPSTHEPPSPTPGTKQAGGTPAPIPSIPEAALDPGALPGTATEISSVPARPSELTPGEGLKPATPWGAAANAGVTVGKGSQKAAIATAGFFTRLSKSISGSF